MESRDERQASHFIEVAGNMGYIDTSLGQEAGVTLFPLKNCLNRKPLACHHLKKTSPDNFTLDCQKSLLPTTTNQGGKIQTTKTNQINKQNENNSYPLKNKPETRFVLLQL